MQKNLKSVIYATLLFCESNDTESFIFAAFKWHWQHYPHYLYHETEVPKGEMISPGSQADAAREFLFKALLFWLAF